MNHKTSSPMATTAGNVSAQVADGSSRLPAGSWRAVLEFARYFIASAGALGVDVALYQLGLRLGWSYPFAALLGFCAGAVVAYVASVRWVFQSRTVRHASLEFGLFIAIGAAGLLLTEVLLWIAIGKFGWPPFVSKLGTSAVVFAFNFALRKFLLFSAARPQRAGRPTTSPLVERAP